MEPFNEYDPSSVALGTKIARHLRRKGWVQSRATSKWVDPRDSKEHEFTAAIRLQLRAEHCTFVEQPTPHCGHNQENHQ